MTMEDTESLTFNGIDGASGDYLLPPLSPRDVSTLAQGERFDPKHLEDSAVVGEESARALRPTEDRHAGPGRDRLRLNIIVPL
jgi:hypothetical protein